MSGRAAAIVLLAALLAACSTTPPRGRVGRGESKPAARAQGGAPAVPLPTNPRGGYYGDDGPPDAVPPGLELTPDAVPRAEPLSPRANRPYVVFGRSYQPMTQHAPYRERGAASWYGRKFHGQATSSGEVYDMFGMSAAHPTLPLPSYVRVTNLRNGRSVVVRVNDRGPFLNNRLIDLSYTAALKLGYAQSGSTEVEVELVLPDEAPSFRVLQASLEGAPQAPSAAAARQPARQPMGQSTAVAAGSPPAPQPAAFPSAAGADDPLRLIVETLAAPDPGAPSEPPAPVFGAAPSPPALPSPPASPAPVGVPPVPAASPTQPGPTVPPTPMPTASMPTASMPPVLDGAQAFVQLGAFSSRVNAEAARYRLADAVDPQGARIEVVEQRGWFKLLAGPLPARDASALADRMRQATGSRPFVVVR